MIKRTFNNSPQSNHLDVPILAQHQVLSNLDFHLLRLLRDEGSKVLSGTATMSSHRQRHG